MTPLRAVATATLCLLCFASCAGPSPASHGEREVFGRSVEGRSLVARHVGDFGANRTLMVVGSIHGDEREGHEIARRVLRSYRHARGLDVWVVRTLNPDGARKDSRENARGVDLNRNFSRGWTGSKPRSSGYYSGPHPFSEPESRAARRLLERVRPDVTIYYHQPWGAVLGPCPRSAGRLERRYARLARMPYDCSRGRSLPGTARRWQNAELPGRSFLVELGPGEIGAASVRRHAGAAGKVARGIRQVATGVRG